MTERDYLAEIADRMSWEPQSEPDVDPDEVQATLYEGVSTSGVVRAYVSGSLAFSHVQIAHLHAPDSLGTDIVEAVGQAMEAAAAAYTTPGLDEAIAERVAAFDAEIDKLDRSMEDLAAWIDGAHADLFGGSDEESSKTDTDVDSDAP